MNILRVFNNNVVLARDGGQEVIVTGRGLGFQARPGMEVDRAKVVKVFVPADGRDPDHLGEMLAMIPGVFIHIVIDSMAEIGMSQDARDRITLVVALADHISGAVVRQSEGNTVAYPLRAEVEHLYAEDFHTAQQLLAVINTRLDAPLPEYEAVALTLHLVNAGFSSGDLAYTYRMTGLIQQMIDVVANHYGQEMRSDTISVARFITHLRYLFVRMRQHQQLDEGHATVGEAIAKAYPDAATCARHLVQIVELRMGQTLTADEEAYLTMHVARLAPAGATGKEPTSRGKDRAEG